MNQRPAPPVNGDLRNFVDADVESIVLAGILSGGEDAYSQVQHLTADDFALEKHRLIYSAVQQIADEINPGLDSVLQRLRETGKLEAVGNLTGLIDVHRQAIPGMRLDGFAKSLRTKSVDRQACRIAAKLTKFVELGFGANSEEALSVAEELRGLAGPSRQGVHFARVDDLPRVEDIGSADIEWDVEDLVPRATVVLLTAESGAGKSTFSCALGYAVSKGKDFLGRKTTKRPVLVLDAENPSVAVIERFQRLRIETDDNFRVWGQWTGEDPPAAGGAIVLDWIARCDPKPLIIVDSLIRFHSGEENDSTETQKYMGTYRKLAAAGATIVLLHHIGKSDSAQDYRGSSDIKAAVDVAYKLTSLGDGAQLSLLELRAFKQRISVTPQMYVRYLDGEFMTDSRETIKTVTEKFVELLEANPGITTGKFEKLAAERNLGRNKARAFLKSGIASGIIRPEGEGNRREHFWRGSSGGDSLAS